MEQLSWYIKKTGKKLIGSYVTDQIIYVSAAQCKWLLPLLHLEGALGESWGFLKYQVPKLPEVPRHLCAHLLLWLVGSKARDFQSCN